ncbi:MAG: hypothetical protein FJ088_01350 [Deltaproteobacteria bacterium]|nr:hypothetical protein [Deltaproteobacteria bacterium]
MSTKPGQLHFSNWQETTSSGTILPRGTSAQLSKFFNQNPDYIHGMIVFDYFVGNNDRKRDNLVLRTDGKLALIDQGNSLLYYKREGCLYGAERLRRMELDPDAIFDQPYHFIDYLNDSDLVKKWCEKIKQIPDFIIISLIENLPELENIDDNLKESSIDFLLNRREYLYTHIISSCNFTSLYRKEGKNE